MKYHVTTNWDGQDLETLYDQYGDEAYDLYAVKWPESDNLSQVHAHVIHLHDSMDDAVQYQAIYGGQILEINDGDLDIAIDDYEYPHPICKSSIPAKSIRIVA